MGVQKQFENACKNGELEKAKEILKNNSNINISAYDECAFEFACQNGHLNIAQWLLQVKSDINISADNEYAFTWTCENGHLRVAQWLQTLKPFKYNIQVENDKIISFKFNTEYEENLLFMLYSLTYKGFTNNLTANLVMDITKYI